MPVPEAPKDIRLVHDSGESMGLEVHYIGRDEEGIYIWEATADAGVLLKPGWRLYCAKLPAHTGVRLGLKGVS